MNRKEQMQFLIKILLEELPAYRIQAEQFRKDETGQRRLLRSLSVTISSLRSSKLTYPPMGVRA